MIALDLEAYINVMVLAGLVVAIGVVVDDAIIDVENIVERLRQARSEGSDVSTFRIVLDASVRCGPYRSPTRRSSTSWRSSRCSSWKGSPGAFFFPLVLAYGLAVLVSMLFVALTVTPALC